MPSSYASHCFRIGVAITAAAAGLPPTAMHMKLKTYVCTIPSFLKLCSVKHVVCTIKVNILYLTFPWYNHSMVRSIVRPLCRSWHKVAVTSTQERERERGEKWPSLNISSLLAQQIEVMY